LIFLPLHCCLNCLFWSCWLLDESCCLVASCFCVGIYLPQVIFVWTFQSPVSICWGFLKDYLGIEAWLECRVPAWKVQGSDLSPQYCQ
jgi:hypothetical protein